MYARQLAEHYEAAGRGHGPGYPQQPGQQRVRGQGRGARPPAEGEEKEYSFFDGPFAFIV